MAVMVDHDRWLIPLVLAGLCTAAMAVLVAGLALALGTTGHDWYAAWKFTLVEAMLAIGFGDYGLVEYRTAAGETVTVERYRLAHMMHEAWRARRLILSLASDRAVLGACTGLSLVALWLSVRAALGLRHLWSGRGAVVERARADRPPPDRLPACDPPGPAKPPPVDVGQGKSRVDKDNRAEPDTEPACQARRHRQYGRWV